MYRLQLCAILCLLQAICSNSWFNHVAAGPLNSAVLSEDQSLDLKVGKKSFDAWDQAQ